MKYVPFLLLLTLNAFAQEDVKVMEPVRLLFDGMMKGDSAMVHRAFHSPVNFFTVLTDSKTGSPQLRAADFKKFLLAIGTPHAETWNELIWSPKIEIDGDLAQVWAPYAFYAGKTFSHCGVDAFQLFKNGSGEWKIFQLTDTRRKTGCDVPKEISDKMK